MSDVKTVHDLEKHSSGDCGYCHYKKVGRGVEIEWLGAKVVAVECEHEICGYADVCEIYKRHPVGFVQTFPNDLTKQKPES